MKENPLFRGGFPFVRLLEDDVNADPVLRYGGGREVDMVIDGDVCHRITLK